MSLSKKEIKAIESRIASGETICFPTPQIPSTMPVNEHETNFYGKLITKKKYEPSYLGHVFN